MLRFMGLQRHTDTGGYSLGFNPQDSDPCTTQDYCQVIALPLTPPQKVSELSPSELLQQESRGQAKANITHPLSKG